MMRSLRWLIVVRIIIEIIYQTKNETHTVQLMMRQFRLHRFEGISNTAALHIFHNQCSKPCSRKLGMNQMRVKLKSHLKIESLLYSIAGLVHTVGIVSFFFLRILCELYLLFLKIRG